MIRITSCTVYFRLFGTKFGTKSQEPPIGVRSLAVTCELCHHEAVLPVDRWGDAVPVRAFGARMVCTVCGIVGADARPDWREMRASGNWR